MDIGFQYEWNKINHLSKTIIPSKPLIPTILSEIFSELYFANFANGFRFATIYLRISLNCWKMVAVTVQTLQKEYIDPGYQACVLLYKIWTPDCPQ